MVDEGHLDEFFHLQQQQIMQQINQNNFAYIGYIASYDPVKNTVTVVNPTNSNPLADPLNSNPAGTPMVEGPMPLATAFCGLSSGINPVNAAVPNWGIQIAPFGGASTVNPTGGEQVLVLNIDPSTGYGMCACMLYNNLALPPGGNIPVYGGKQQSGEMLIVGPSGTVIHIKNNGDVNIFARNATTPTGNVNVNANGGIGISSVAVPDVVTPAPIAGVIALTAALGIAETAGAGITQEAVLDISSTAGGAITQHAVVGAITQTAGAAITQTAGAAIELTALGGEIGLDASAAVNISAGGLASLGAVGTVTITAGGAILIKANAATVTVQSGTVLNLTAPSVIAGDGVVADTKSLLTAALWEFITTHTHSGGTGGGGNTGMPNSPPVEGTPYTTVAFAAD